MSARRYCVAAFALFANALAAAVQAQTAPRQELRFETHEGTWMSLDVCADGQRIVFDLLGDIYELPMEGGTAKRLLGGTPFESQPVCSPDGARIAFVSDRSGSENLWTASRDGTDLRQLSFLDDNTEFSSPAWSADGRSVFASRIKVDKGVFELWSHAADGSGGGTQLTQGAPQPGLPKRARRSALGAVASPDGKSIYYAARTGDFLEQQAYEQLPFPLWSIVRRNLASGAEETLISPPGGAMRPRVSPDGTIVAYGSRQDARTGLRIRNLRSGTDEWLAFPAQRDEQEGWPSRDTLPGYAFTPDGKSLVISRDGKLERIDIASRTAHAIPFTAEVSLQVGRFPPRRIVEPDGPVRARLIQAPTVSPDGKRLAFSTFGHIYTMELRGDAKPRRLTKGSTPEFQPSWTPDGRSILFVTWTARGGHVWSAPADGRGAARQLTTESDLYSNPVATPDGREIVALRSSNYQHVHTHIKLGPFRQADLIRMPVAGGAQRIVTSGALAGPPQFTRDSNRVHLFKADGFVSMELDGTAVRRLFSVAGPGPHFHEGPYLVEDVRISPDGLWALVLTAPQQLNLVHVTPQDTGPLAIDLSVPSPSHHQITAVGADFIGWADAGRTITWSVGSTFYRAAMREPPEKEDEPSFPENAEGRSHRYEVTVELPRDVPQGTVILRGATAITMRGEEAIDDADVVVRGNRILSVGQRGSVEVPREARILDMSGKFIVPGFVDAHAHWTEVRRGILDLENWGFLANLAYGVTAGLDISPLSIDVLAYRDLLDAGLMTGLRAYSSGPAVLSWNRFASRRQVVDVVSRYRDHYRVGNLKGYWSGNRRQRQWVAEVAAEMGLVSTTEGALNEKLMLTQVMDGFAGSEHALPTVPVSRDVIELFTRMGVSYTPTLITGNGGPHAKSRFLTDGTLHDDPKFRRFVPHFVVDELTTRRSWYLPQEYTYPQVAASAAQIVRGGGLLAVGGHGEVEGLSFQWEMQALASGGLTPMEILRAATMGSSETIGRAHDLGSLEPGKLADLVILGADPRIDIANTLSIREVMKNGRLYNGDTLDEMWPQPRPRPPAWFAGE